MKMNAQLKITKKCGRCGKAEEFIGNLEDAQRLMDQNKTRETTLAHIEEVVAGLAEVDEPPTIIVLQLDPETGKYAHKALYDVCSKEAGEGKRRGCTARITDLVADIFNEQDENAEPKVRKPRTKKTATAETAPETTGTPVIATLLPENEPTEETHA
jgi:hypothetical protein